jgi:transcription elongation factor GreA
MKRPITPRGYNALRRELHNLKSQRPEIARAIEIARGHGDLSENGDYDAAKEKSGMVEAKIRDIEAKLSYAEIIDPRKMPNPTRVVFGTTTRVLDIDADEEKVFSIVGADESNIEKNWISCESPLGKSLIGKEIGDVAKSRVPGGEREYEILEISIDYEDDSEGEQAAQ